MNTKVFAMMLLIFTASSLTAQTRIGLSGGAVFANVSVHAQGVSASAKMRTGITGGLFIEVPIGTGFTFQPALNFVQKGYSAKDETGTDRISFNYIEVPLNFVYSPQKNKGFFIGAGPSISYGLSGKEKFKYAGTGMPDQITKIKFGSGNDEVKAVDFGANALAGYQFANGFMISGSYNLGLSNLRNGSTDTPDETATIKNRYFSIKIGYEFPGKKRK